jgi:glycosyltransferase involved in cell wall biosynthesis
VNPRVLFVDHAGVLGGAELSLLDIVRCYADSSKVLLFADGPFYERLQQAGAAVELLPTPRAVTRISRMGNVVQDLLTVPSVSTLAWQVARLARDYDVLYANSQKALVVGALAGKLAGKPVIWHLRVMLTADHFSGGHRWLGVALANRMVARVIANSRATAAAFVESGGRAERVRVVYNGIDPRRFASVVPTEVDALRKELGLAGVPIVGTFGRLAPGKGQHVLLEALARLPGVHALLVGEALFGEDAYAQVLRERARALEVADRVRFLGFRQDIPRLMRLSDVVVQPSIEPEGFGRVIVEGMLSRKPVVATCAGGAVEIIENGVSGVLVSPGDSQALAGVLLHLLTDACRGRALAKVGYAAASERFSLQAMLEGVEQQIQEVTPQRRQSRVGCFSI